MYGWIEHGSFKETDQLNPRSPYSAAKAAGDLLARAYHVTFKVPIVITRSSNNYGPYQHPEKLIPLFITNLLSGKKVPVYGDGLNVRDWLYVKDHCTAIDVVIQRGRLGEVYNIGGNNEWKNIDIVKLLLRQLNKPDSLIRFVTDRPGHDRRYAIDPSKIMTELGWKPRITFEQGLPLTIDWYIKNESWWRRIISGEYQNYYKEMYENR